MNAPTSRAPGTDDGPTQSPAQYDEPYDPFGSRLDEKPPRGWDDRFWDDVRVRIEDSRGSGDEGKLPDPGRWRRRGARAAGALTVLLFFAGVVAALRWQHAGVSPTVVSPTVVRVLGTDLPDVEVDWARLGGHDAGAAVFRSIDPDISYVYIDQSLPPLATHAVTRDAAVVRGAIRVDEPQGLIRMFRGRLIPSTQEVEVTTFFRDAGFLLLSGADGTGAQDAGLEDEIVAHARGVWSLGEVTPLGASRMSLSGGAVVVDGGPHSTRLTIEGEPVGPDSVRLRVSQSNEGKEVVATSVVARRGRTIILAGGGSSGSSDDELLLVAFTLL